MIHLRVKMRSLLIVIAVCGVAFAAEEIVGGFAAYPKARLLCDEHVLGNTMEIHWQTYAVKDDVKKVAKFYEKKTGKKGTKNGTGDLSWWNGAENVLAIYPAAKSDAYPKCSVATKKGERTVIAVSSAIRR
jgi:hypothetical protein